MSNTTERRKIKVTILALHLGYGGVENSISSLANMLSNKYDVEIISTYKLYDKPIFELNSNITINYLLPSLKPNKEELKNAIHNKNFFKIIYEGAKSIKILYLKRHLTIKAIKNLDTHIIFTTRLLHNRWVGKYSDDRIIKIAQEHNHHNNNNKYIKKVVSSLKNIDYLLPVSKELTEFYEKKLIHTKTKVLHIPHALDIFPETTSNLKSKNIVSIGRLSKEKGFLDLIDVFKQIYEIDKTASLKIIGDGSEKDLIQQKIIENNLQKSITLCGAKSKAEIAKIMLESSLYLMTSFTESFGLVLLEAESFGLPLISFDSAQGSNEIIKDNINGFIIKNRNKKEMAEKSCLLLNDLNKRLLMGKQGRNFSKNYTQKSISQIWYNFIDSIYGGN